MRFFFTVVLIFYITLSLAQPGGGKGGGLPTYTQAEEELLLMSAHDNPFPPNNPDPVPISGIEILLGLGAVFGAKRMISYHRKKKKEE
jgi:hypothetical protein